MTTIDPRGLTGSSGAMRLWSNIIAKVSSKPYIPVMPDSVEMVQIDRESGLLSGQGCENAIELPFIRGSAPREYAECAGATSSNWFQNLFGD